jgi:hypothetical protein
MDTRTGMTVQRINECNCKTHEMLVMYYLRYSKVLVIKSNNMRQVVHVLMQNSGTEWQHQNYCIHR